MAGLCQAIDADTKLIPSWMLGMRGPATARDFMEDLAGRLAIRVQLTTDGLRCYLQAVKAAFGSEINYAMPVRVYGNSPAVCLSCESHAVTGTPHPEHISTSYIERQNLTMRMSMRRFTRLTNAFSTKVENLAASVALYVMRYNFGRKHMTLGTTRAIKAGLADHIWSVEEIAGLLERHRSVKLPSSNCTDNRISILQPVPHQFIIIPTLFPTSPNLLMGMATF